MQIIQGIDAEAQGSNRVLQFTVPDKRPGNITFNGVSFNLEDISISNGTITASIVNASQLNADQYTGDFAPKYDDQQGTLSTTTGGGSALGTLAIRDTGCTMLSFQNANDDVAVMVYQFTHRKKLDTNLESLHLHYYLPEAPAAGNTVRLLYNWVWYNNGDVLPALSGWNSGTYVHTFTGSEAQFSTGIMEVVTDLAHPINENESSIFRVKVTRDSTGGGSDTYAADLGIDYFDVHFVTNRIGSETEF